MAGRKGRGPDEAAPRPTSGVSNQRLVGMLSAHSGSVRSTSRDAGLAIADVDDPVEREAERVAERPGTRPVPGRSPRQGSLGGEPARLVREVLRSPGQPLDAATIARFAPRFGGDLATVRVHTDPAAGTSARSLGALAYTVGRHIAFGPGRFSPGSPDGRRLIAHELAHVVQQQGTPPVVQRAPDPDKRDVRGKGAPKGSGQPDREYPLFKPADQVVDLTRGAGDDWELVVSGHVTEESISRVMWPSVRPPWVKITFKVAVVDPVSLGIFRIEGITPTAHQVMEPSFAKLFADRGLVDESVETDAEKDARELFQRRHAGLGEWRLRAVNAALRQATRRNRDLLIAWYRYYADHDFDSEDMSGLGETSSGDTSINDDVLLLQSKFPTDDPLSLLASTLIHEYVHTPQGSGGTVVGTARDEAKAYGIELFFAERMGDTQREKVISNRYNKNDAIDVRMGGDRIFNESYYIMKQLYKIIDQGGPSAAEARVMSVDFISNNESRYGPKLQAFISKHR